jgi:hypothetical protein
LAIFGSQVRINLLALRPIQRADLKREFYQCPTPPKIQNLDARTFFEHRAAFP